VLDPIHSAIRTLLTDQGVDRGAGPSGPEIGREAIEALEGKGGRR
jgi:hypothetical protein